ncbi:MAG TPA: hypothetical protein VK206_01705 [Anaerolineales bacterium]|nr:hypothetical protein [Anaerolineales bacterium]HLO32557.1 hypothetical protein [Anaerolineales bacterium]
MNKVAPEKLQHQVDVHVRQLLAYGIKTFHADVNFEDYSGYGTLRPDLNGTIFTPLFLQRLKRLVHGHGGYLNLHLLTDFPKQHFSEYEAVEADAICFQLESLPNDCQLAALIEAIQRSGACASPVIETVGSEGLVPPSPESVFSRLKPLLAEIGMLTLQVAGTTSRSNTAAGGLAIERARAYIDTLRPVFAGTLQFQGGITTRTIGQAVRLGAEFVVCGTEIFRNREGRTAEAVIDELLQRAAQSLVGSEKQYGPNKSSSACLTNITN